MSQKLSCRLSAVPRCACEGFTPSRINVTPFRTPTLHSPSNTAQSIGAASDVLAGAWERGWWTKSGPAFCRVGGKPKVGRFMNKDRHPLVIGLGSQDPKGDLTADRPLPIVLLMSSRPGQQVMTISWCTTDANIILCPTDDFCPQFEYKSIYASKDDLHHNAVIPPSHLSAPRHRLKHQTTR